MKILHSLMLFLLISLVQGCAPKFGTQEWCKSMKDKPKSEWTAKDSMGFMDSCKMSDLIGK